jgi:hypothetical protein
LRQFRRREADPQAAQASDSRAQVFALWQTGDQALSFGQGGQDKGAVRYRFVTGDAQFSLNR